MQNSKAERSRNLRYKRPALASMSFWEIWDEIDSIGEKCVDIHWWMDTDDETLLNALDGDEDDAFEFRMAFSDLEAECEQVSRMIQDVKRQYDDFEQVFNDCTVALIGNRYSQIGYDDYEEDYFALTSYEAGLGETEAGKRVMRMTKKDMLSTIGQCVGILLAYWNLRQKFDYLSATFDILRDQNTSLLDTIKEIEKLYEKAEEDDFYWNDNATKQYDRLLDTLPEDIWVI